MLGDAADYSEYKNGRRATGLIFSAGTFAMKFGSGVAGAITLAVLNVYNYNGQTTVKTAEMFEGIKLNMSVVPALFVVYGKEYVKLCNTIGKTAEADEAKMHIENMIEAVKKEGWDGDWYLRTYDYYENKVGTNESEEGKIL